MRRAVGTIAIAALLAGCGEIAAGSDANHGGFTLSKVGFYGYALSGCLKPTVYSATAWTPDFQLHGPGGRQDGYTYLYTSSGTKYLTAGTWTGSFGYLAPFNAALRNLPPTFRPAACAWTLTLTPPN